MTTQFYFDLRAVARALGGQVTGAEVLAPGPGHGPRDRSLSLKLSATSPDGFIVYSHAGDDWRMCRDHALDRLGLLRGAWRRDSQRAPSPKPAVEPRDLERDLAARRIASEIIPLISTSAAAYLRNVRKIDVGAIEEVLNRSDAIGWHSGVFFNEPGHSLHGQNLGCIVGVMTEIKTAKPTGAITRTYIAADLTKIGKAKTLGSPAGIVRLSEDADVLGGLFLGEGLETALAAMSIGLRPMWSVGSTSLMRSFPVLNGIEALNVVVDNDPNGAGERAARELEARWLAADREVNLFRPAALGDLNDVLQGRAS